MRGETETTFTHFVVYRPRSADSGEKLETTIPPGKIRLAEEDRTETLTGAIGKLARTWARTWWRLRLGKLRSLQSGGIISPRGKGRLSEAEWWIIVRSAVRKHGHRFVSRLPASAVGCIRAPRIDPHGQSRLPQDASLAQPSGV